MEAILLITVLSGPFDGQQFTVPFTTMQACLDAKNAVSDTLDYDHKLVCLETP